MSPLAIEIYKQLIKHLRAKQESITYGALAAKVESHHRSPQFHEALGEVTTACRTAHLPALPAMVWSSSANRPGGGYYKVAHSRSRSELAAIEAWKKEHGRVVEAAATYPAVLP